MALSWSESWWVWSLAWEPVGMGWEYTPVQSREKHTQAFAHSFPYGHPIQCVSLPWTQWFQDRLQIHHRTANYCRLQLCYILSLYICSKKIPFYRLLWWICWLQLHKKISLNRTSKHLKEKKLSFLYMLSESSPFPVWELLDQLHHQCRKCWSALFNNSSQHTHWSELPSQT